MSGTRIWPSLPHAQPPIKNITVSLQDDSRRMSFDVHPAGPEEHLLLALRGDGPSREVLIFRYASTSSLLFYSGWDLYCNLACNGNNAAISLPASLVVDIDVEPYGCLVSALLTKVL